MEKTRSEYSGDRLDLRDIGVTADELKALRPQPDNLVKINDYRSPEDARAIDSKERKKKVKAVLLAGATLIGSAKLAVEMFKEKIHPIAFIQSAEQLNDAVPVEIEDIKPGDELGVSPYSFTVTGGNVRTSPHAESGGAEPDDNLVKADLTGKVIAHPIEVADENNPANPDWYVFYDADGQKFAINGQNLEVVHGQNTIGTSTMHVMVDKVTNKGIIAHNNDNTMQVAAVVDTFDSPNA